jgi:integrase/recombinase XerD
MRLEDLDIGGQLIALRGKGHRELEWVPASPDAMLWLALYLAETEQSRPATDTRLWWTLRRPARPLTYSALRHCSGSPGGPERVVRRRGTRLHAA